MKDSVIVMLNHKARKTRQLRRDIGNKRQKIKWWKCLRCLRNNWNIIRWDDKIVGLMTKPKQIVDIKSDNQNIFTSFIQKSIGNWFDKIQI